MRTGKGSGDVDSDSDVDSAAATRFVPPVAGQCGRGRFPLNEDAQTYVIDSALNEFPHRDSALIRWAWTLVTADTDLQRRFFWDALVVWKGFGAYAAANLPRKNPLRPAAAVYAAVMVRVQAGTSAEANGDDAHTLFPADAQFGTSEDSVVLENVQRALVAVVKACNVTADDTVAHAIPFFARAAFTLQVHQEVNGPAGPSYVLSYSALVEAACFWKPDPEFRCGLTDLIALYELMSIVDDGSKDRNVRRLTALLRTCVDRGTTMLRAVAKRWPGFDADMDPYHQVPPEFPGARQILLLEAVWTKPVGTVAWIWQDWVTADPSTIPPATPDLLVSQIKEYLPAGFHQEVLPALCSAAYSILCVDVCANGLTAETAELPVVLLGHFSPNKDRQHQLQRLLLRMLHATQPSVWDHLAARGVERPRLTRPRRGGREGKSGDGGGASGSTADGGGGTGGAGPSPDMMYYSSFRPETRQLRDHVKLLYSKVWEDRAANYTDVSPGLVMHHTRTSTWVVNKETGRLENPEGVVLWRTPTGEFFYATSGTNFEPTDYSDIVHEAKESNDRCASRFLHQLLHPTCFSAAAVNSLVANGVLTELMLRILVAAAEWGLPPRGRPPSELFRDLCGPLPRLATGGAPQSLLVTVLRILALLLTADSLILSAATDSLVRCFRNQASTKTGGVSFRLLTRVLLGMGLRVATLQEDAPIADLPFAPEILMMRTKYGLRNHTATAVPWHPAVQDGHVGFRAEDYLVAACLIHIPKHVVVGVFCDDGKPVVYDSNYSSVQNFDWLSRPTTEYSLSAKKMVQSRTTLYLHRDFCDLVFSASHGPAAARFFLDNMLNHTDLDVTGL